MRRIHITLGSQLGQVVVATLIQTIGKDAPVPQKDRMRVHACALLEAGAD
jgi:hypothetical protein